MKQDISRLDRFFRALAVIGVAEILGLSYNLVVHPFTPGVIGQAYGLRIFIGLVIGPAMMLVAALILWRVPGNVVGRLLLLVALGLVGAQFDFHLSSSVRSAFALALFLIYLSGLAFPSLIYLMLHFPTGKVYPSWLGRWVILFAVLKLIGVALEILASPNELEIVSLPGNPLFTPSLAPLRPFLSATIGVVGVMVPLGLVAGLASIGLRYRASNAHQRQQIKWVVWAFGVLAVMALLMMGLVLSGAAGPVLFNIGLAVIALALLNFVASIGIGILRHHLFDIDIIIHRTLVYSALTSLLTLVYFGSVVLLQSLFRILTGETSQLAIVLSTLTLAALFVPLRNRIQAGIDRRFYRRKYDAAKTLTAFAATARDETDLDKLMARLVDVVDQTMQPEEVSLWLREPPGKAKQ